MMDTLQTKEIIKCATLGIYKGMKTKKAISISIAFSSDIFIRNENMIPKNKKLFEIKFCIYSELQALKVGRIVENRTISIRV